MLRKILFLNVAAWQSRCGPRITLGLPGAYRGHA